jgi:chondroitin AC lyase
MGTSGAAHARAISPIPQEYLHMLRYTLALTVCILAVTSTALAAPAEPQRDIDIIKGRIIARYVPSDAGFKSLQKKAAGYANAIQPDGSWADVNYTDKGRSRWATGAHLSRMRELAMVYHTQTASGSVDDAIKQAALSSVRFWLETDPKNPNWWWNQIGTQLTLGPAMLLLGDALPADLRTQGVVVMKRSSWKTWTGQNLVWGVTLQIMRGCVEESPEVIQEAYDRMYQEIRVFPPGQESIQVDFSFHQHGSQLYSGGYGRGFASNGAEFIHHARETRFAAPKEVVDVMNGYILDGQQWMMRGLTFDYSAVGREITRAGGGGSALLSAAWKMVELGGPRTQELEAYVTRMKTRGKECPLTGNRHFWRSDYMTHHRPGYFASVRMASSRNRRSEVCNSEGRKSHHLADGVMFLYQTGNEYYNIFPVWDWQRVPGTTCEQMDWAKKGKVGGVGETVFAGGVSDGGYGLAVMDFKRGALASRNAWFMFDDAVVCLGAAITCATENPVFTSINQCHLNGAVTVSGSDVPLAAGRYELTTPGWVHHDSTGYVVLSKGTARVANEAQTGAWSDISTGSGTPVTLDVFSLWLDHGTKVNDGRYAYIVYPGTALADMPAKAKAENIEILANTTELQAVCHTALGIIQVAFYTPGTLSCGEGRTIRVDQPCLIQARAVGPDIQLAVSNPANKALDVTVELGANDGTATKTTLSLPVGPMAGSTGVKAVPGLSRGGK